MSATKEQRRQMRQMLRRWARVPWYCMTRQREIEKYKDLLESARDLKPSNLDGMPKGNGVGSKVESAVLAIERLRDRYDEKINTMLDDISKELEFEETINAAIADLSQDEQKIIELRYKKNIRFEHIPCYLPCSFDSAKKIERRAINKLAKSEKLALLGTFYQIQ